MAYLVLRALSHPLWLLEKTARVETLFVQESSEERSSFHRGCWAVLLGASKDPPHPSPKFPRAELRWVPTSWVMASEEESIRRRFMGDFCCDSTKAL